MNLELTQLQASAFFESVSVMYGAGMTIRDAVKAFSEESEDDIQRIGQIIVGEIDNGCGFAEACEKTRAFSTSTIGTLKSAEYAGRLEETMKHIGLEFEHRNEMTEHVRHAVFYPSVIMLMMSAILAVMVFAVLPMFQKVYQNLTGSVAGSAFSYILISKVIGTVSLVVVVVISIILLSCFLSFRRESQREKLYRVLEKLKFSAPTFQKIGKVQVLDSLATLLASGSDPAGALHMISSSISNAELKKTIHDCVQVMETGAGMAEAMLDNHFLALVDGKVLDGAEKSGKLEEELLKLSQRMDRETQNELNSMVDKVEPILVSLLTLFVGLSLLSVMLPLLGIVGAL